MSEFFGQEIQIITVSVPVGTMVEYAGDTAPNDWMLCDGRALNRSTYAALFAVLGVKFGSGDGSGAQFNIPDCRDRVTVGASATKPSGAIGGAETNTLDTTQIPSHQHNVSASGATGAADRPLTHNHNVLSPYGIIEAYGDLSQIHVATGSAYGLRNRGGGAHIGSTYDGGAPDHLHGFSFSVLSAAMGGGQPFTNMQPYVTCNKVIKVV